MKPRVYAETSVISYCDQTSAFDVITAGQQATTYKWWEEKRPNCDSEVSQLLVDQAAGGDPVATAKRKATSGGIARLNVYCTEITSWCKPCWRSERLRKKHLLMRCTAPCVQCRK